MRALFVCVVCVLVCVCPSSLYRLLSESASQPIPGQIVQYVSPQLQVINHISSLLTIGLVIVAFVCVCLLVRRGQDATP